MDATPHVNRRDLIESAVAALQAERLSLIAERSAPKTAEAFHRLGSANAVALMAFAESRVIATMLRLARAELTMAEEGVRAGDAVFASRALNNAEAWFTAALASCPTEAAASGEPAGCIH